MSCHHLKLYLSKTELLLVPGDLSLTQDLVSSIYPKSGHWRM